MRAAGAAAIGAAAVYIYKSGETPEEVIEVSIPSHPFPMPELVCAISD